MSNLQDAAQQYATRPADERFNSIAAYLENARHDKAYSRETSYNTKDLRVVPVDAVQSDDPAGRALIRANTLRLQSPRGTADFTHWSFGQLCRMVGAPGSYVRTLPPTIAADCLNHGLTNTATATDAKILVKANGTAPIIRACTSETYGRVWDADLAESLQPLQTDQRWELPPTWEGPRAGAYRGDRDSFLLLTNGGSIVSDPSAGQGDSGAMYRGVMVRNSEVGACSITIDLILFRYICGNHILWGASFDQRFRRRHVGEHARRDATRTLLSIANRYAQQSASRDEQIIRELISKEIATTRDGVIDELRGLGCTREQAANAYDTTTATENASPRSYWGLSQGLTRLSQTSGYQDQRFELDQIAAALLQKGRKLVAA